jgi:hypothetical protein
MRGNIKRGAAWLDKHYPDWEWRINLDKLDLGRCSECVLGQLAGGYLTAMETLLIDPADHGFYLEDTAVNAGAYKRLTNAWKQFILERRKAKEDSSCSCSLARSTRRSSSATTSR